MFVKIVSDGYLVPIVGIRYSRHDYTDTNIQQVPTSENINSAFKENEDNSLVQPSATTENDYDNQQPNWSLNYLSPSYNRSAESFSTRDLISWSFQIARGMNYLTTKKVLIYSLQLIAFSNLHEIYLNSKLRCFMEIWLPATSFWPTKVSLKWPISAWPVSCTKGTNTRNRAR